MTRTGKKQKTILFRFLPAVIMLAVFFLGFSAIQILGLNAFAALQESMAVSMLSASAAAQPMPRVQKSPSILSAELIHAPVSTYPPEGSASSAVYAVSAFDYKNTNGYFYSASGGRVVYRWGEAAPESTRADDKWFSGSAFIGNSLCDGLGKYGGINYASFLAAHSITVFNIYSNVAVCSGESCISITSALASGKYNRVFIMLGINEIYISDSYFYECYAKLIDYVRSVQPDAEIYIQAILPVTRAKSDSSSTFCRDNVQNFNSILRQLACDKKVFYIDTYSAFADADGYLPAECSSDGIHLTPTAYQKWHEYLLTHTISQRAQSSWGR